MKFKHLDINLSEPEFPILSIDCPEVSNAFDDVVINELRHALAYIKTLSSARALFLTGTGKHFSAGANLSWMQQMVHYDFERNLTDAKSLAMLVKELNEFPLTTIALVNGAAFGGAVGLVAACDMSLAHINATFCLSEVKLGLIPSVISPYVIRAIGEKEARRFFLTAEKFTARKAKAIGLVSEVYTDTDKVNMIKQLKTGLLKNGPEAVKAAKQLIFDMVHGNISNEMIEETAVRIANIRVSAEGQEGLKAFLEKRDAKWVG